MTNEEQLEELISKLDALVKLTAINILKDKTPTERITTLLDFGFESKAIANILGTKDNIMRAIKSQHSKKTEKKTKTKSKSEMIKQSAEKTG